MVIANACGHPDCANARDMLKHTEAVLVEVSRERGQALAERDEARAKLSAAQERLDDWHKVADRRSAEIIRLMGELELAKQQLAHDAMASVAAWDEAKRLTEENEALRAELAKGGRD